MLDARLETLLTICEKSSFTKAAEALALTQPAVSHHMKMLESELGVHLFVRARGELKLTPEGEIVAQYARRMKAMQEKMLRALADAEKQMSSIRVGITHTAESNTIAEVLAKYTASTPGMRVTIITDTIRNLYDMIDHYEVDLAIVEGKTQDPELNALLLDTDYLVCVVSNHSALAKKSMVTLADIQKERMILRLPGSGTQNLFLSHLESMGRSIEEFNVVLQVDNIATIKDLIRKDLGISILARSACMDELRKGKLTALPIENLSMVRETNILYHKDFSHPEVLQAITRLYQETARQYQ
ncbi:MAG: LysR family transcriptional regulator [Clostridiales bacterium]|nr:LysR family transcriptional regulator [Clostridiales bacterium]